MQQIIAEFVSFYNLDRIEDDDGIFQMVFLILKVCFIYSIIIKVMCNGSIKTSVKKSPSDYSFLIIG